LDYRNKQTISAWVSLENTDKVTYKSDHVAQTSDQWLGLQFIFLNKKGNQIGASPLFEPQGRIIEGWQKIEGTFTVPMETTYMMLRFRGAYSGSSDLNTYFDDIRINPELSSMQTYVYNKTNLKLQAVLDDNNYATLYYYDEQGNLFLIKKETERGIQTIQESFAHSKKQ
jgi:hypothetical protein